MLTVIKTRRRASDRALVHQEKVFEDAVESALLAKGWMKGSNEPYDHALMMTPQIGGRVAVRRKVARKGADIPSRS